jgi:enterochelin esterase-like enzyme
MARWIILFLLLLTVSTVSANPSRANCLDCAELLEEAENLAGGEWLLIIDGEDISFLYRTLHRDTDKVFLCCGIQDYLNLLDEDTALWGLTVHVPRLDEAIIGYSFWEEKRGEFLSQSEYQIWRGENASPAPPKSDPVQGTIENRSIESEALNERRDLTIYTPPYHDSTETYPVIYLADGQSVWEFAKTIEALILAGDVPPMLLVGVHSGEYRAEEYVPSMRSIRFGQHEEFFTREVRLWAEETLGASTEASQRAVYGHSNGGTFAVAMALLHPELYGIAFPFSVSQNPFDTLTEAEIDPDLRLYFTAGTIETEFFENTQQLSETFAEAGAESHFSERVAGHDFIMWGEELYHAVNWAFGE